MTYLDDKLSEDKYAADMTLVLGRVVEFRAYCCNLDSDAIMGVAKEPVPLLMLDSGRPCVNESMSWDLTTSYAPGSTINSWTIDFGDDSSPSSGATIGTASGTHTYTEAGTYEIEVTISEGTGLSQTITRDINVLDCSRPPDLILNDAWTYVSFNGNGVYFIDWSEDTPTWTSINNGLEGDALFVRNMVMHPNTKKLSSSNHELWIATKDGIYKTTNGGQAWTKLTMGAPENVTYADSPAPAEADLDWFEIVFDDSDKDAVYILAANADPDETLDGWKILHHGAEAGAYHIIDNDSTDTKLYVCLERTPDATLRLLQMPSDLSDTSLATIYYIHLTATEMELSVSKFIDDYMFLVGEFDTDGYVLEGISGTFTQVDPGTWGNLANMLYRSLVDDHHILIHTNDGFMREMYKGSDGTPKFRNSELPSDLDPLAADVLDILQDEIILGNTDASYFYAGPIVYHTVNRGETFADISGALPQTYRVTGILIGSSD